MPVFFVGGIAWTGSQESLWVDELHSSWVVADSFADIGERARAGNQSPTYFAPLWLWTQALGHSEAALRFPSLLASALVAGVACCWLLAGVLSRSDLGNARGGASAELLDGASASSNGHTDFAFRGGPAVTAIAASALIGLDRIQLFYASEARVYALLQLLQLCGWLCVIVGVRHSPSRMVAVWCWCLLAVTSVHLHVISLLPIAWQAAALVAGRWWFAAQPRRFKDLVPVASALVLTAGLCAPAVWGASAVWGRRSQWESFAGDASWNSVAQLFPWWQTLLIACVGWGLDCLWMRIATHSSHTTPIRKPARPGPWVEPMIWLLAIAGPLLTAWCVTAWGLAPILHRRYLLCCSLPLVMLSVLLLQRIRASGVRTLALAGMVGALLFSQGTVGIWRSGMLVGWQRGEDWRAASSWIEQGYQQGDEIWCASGLIEGQELAPPLTPAADAYLSFPLRGIYRVSASAAPPHALVGDASYWLQQWLEHRQNDQRLNIVARCHPALLARIVEMLQPVCRQLGWNCTAIGPVRAFGSLSGVRLDLSRAG